MKPQMLAAQSRLQDLLDQNAVTAGMYVRGHGDHLIVGRTQTVPGSDETENSDRVRLTRINASTYGLSVRRHTGRWERTPFTGSMKEMVDTTLATMQHLVADY